MRKFDVRSDVLSSVKNCHTALDEIEDRTPLPRLPVVPGHQVVGRVAALGPRGRLSFGRLSERVLLVVPPLGTRPLFTD